tara:strand:+ start:194 stop:658 length:465 start_codon:yes stop_codon:yes gene_type:complete
MPAGRPAKPIEQKRLLGNPGKRALPDESSIVLMQQIDSVPEPPRPLLKYGNDLWERIWGMGATWISDKTDIELLLMTCEMVDERWNLRARVMQDMEDSKARRGLRELDRQIVSNLSLLGFTPSDRSRLGVAEVKAKTRLEELLERKAMRDHERN